MSTTTLHLKANSRGSWANVLEFPAERLDEIKAASRQLVIAAGRTVSFKITDDHHVTQHSLDARRFPLTWADRTAT